MLDLQANKLNRREVDLGGDGPVKGEDIAILGLKRMMRKMDSLGDLVWRMMMISMNRGI